MNAIAYKSETKYELALLGSSLITVLYLFYRDEGYYNFSWMSNIGTWIIFVEFVIFLATVQLLLLVFTGAVLKKLPALYRTILSCLVGIPTGVTLIFVFGNFMQA